MRRGAAVLVLRRVIVVLRRVMQHRDVFGAAVLYRDAAWCCDYRGAATCYGAAVLYRGAATCYGAAMHPSAVSAVPGLVVSVLFSTSRPRSTLWRNHNESISPIPFTGDMHTERRIFGIASRCGTFGTRHTEMVLSARQAFQPPHIICMFFARHIQLCFRLSQVARPLGRGVHRQEEELRNTNVRRSAVVRFVGRERCRFILHPAPFFQLFFQKKTGGPFSADVVGEIKLRLRTRK